MKKVMLLMLAVVCFAEGASAASDIKYKKNAKVFAEIVQKYCINYKSSPATIEEGLKEDGYKRNYNYDSPVFEKFIEAISYSVNPDYDGCTTDVLIKRSDRLLFDAAQIESTLETQLGLRKVKSTTDYSGTGLDKTKVLKTEYTDKSGGKYELIFPQENQKKHYLGFNVYWESDASLATHGVTNVKVEDFAIRHSGVYLDLLFKQRYSKVNTTFGGNNVSKVTIPAPYAVLFILPERGTVTFDRGYSGTEGPYTTCHAEVIGAWDSTAKKRIMKFEHSMVWVICDDKYHAKRNFIRFSNWKDASGWNYTTNGYFWGEAVVKDYKKSLASAVSLSIKTGNLDELNYIIKRPFNTYTLVVLKERDRLLNQQGEDRVAILKEYEDALLEMRKSMTLLEKLDAGALLRFTPYNTILFDNHRRALKESIFKGVGEKNNIAGYEWFIETYPKASQVKEAIEKIHDLAFEEAEGIDSISSYNTFIIAYPSAAQVKEANELAKGLEYYKYNDTLPSWFRSIMPDFIASFFNGIFGIFSSDEKKSRALLIKAKQIERDGNDYYGSKKDGYVIIANRMYGLLQEEYDDTDATLRYLESEEFKDFVRTFKSVMRSISSKLDNIADYSSEILEVSKQGFSNEKADRDMSEYYTKQHRAWEKQMHLQDKGYM